MATKTLNYRYLAPGLDLALELRPLNAVAADPLNGSGGDDFTESGTEPGFYVATVDSAGLVGDYWAQVKLGSAIVEQGKITLQDITQAQNLNQLFAAGSSGQVAAFTAAAMAQLAGLSVSFLQPTFTGSGFAGPFIRGDSYAGDLAPFIRLSGWEFTDPTTADSITLRARNVTTGDEFEWTGTPTAVDATTFDITFTVVWEDEDQQPNGVYQFELELIWADPAETITPIEGATLVLKGDL